MDSFHERRPGEEGRRLSERHRSLEKRVFKTVGEGERLWAGKTCWCCGFEKGGHRREGKTASKISDKTTGSKERRVRKNLAG